MSDFNKILLRLPASGEVVREACRVEGGGWGAHSGAFASKREVAWPLELLRDLGIRDSGVAKVGVKLEAESGFFKDK